MGTGRKLVPLYVLTLGGIPQANPELFFVCLPGAGCVLGGRARFATRCLRAGRCNDVISREPLGVCL